MGVVPYRNLVLEAISKAGVPGLFSQNPPYVVVLERLARAAGATNWYVLRQATQLSDLATKLSPGSSLSFYFDGRLAVGNYDAALVEELLRIARIEHDAVIGKLSDDGITLEVDFVANLADLEEFRRALAPGTPVYHGAFPARDNDGKAAVTIDLPDRDGVVRKHPH